MSDKDGLKYFVICYDQIDQEQYIPKHVLIDGDAMVIKDNIPEFVSIYLRDNQRIDSTN